MMLGNLISSALARVGLTEAAVSEWLGAPCGCAERREKLNQLHWWAKRVAAGKVKGMKGWLINWVVSHEL